MLQPGSRLGRYEIRSLLGVGGMGEVYLAHDAQLQRPVALKVLGDAVRNDVELRERLAWEARAASALNHPNILTVYDVGNIGDTHFIATEYVDGITLRQRMSTPGTTLPDAIDVLIQVASALAAAEAAGLVHRDIKPDNVMLRRDGYVKLLDFGLARQTRSEEPHPSRSDPAVVRGTVFYMSPEQLRGLGVDSRSDLWSLGVVMYELVSGRLPFEGISATDVAASILRSDPPPLTLANGAPAPPRLTSIVGRAMAKERSQRYANAAQLLHELESLRSDLEHHASAVIGTAEARQATTEQLSLEGTPATNLPVEMTPLVGREFERSEIASLLRRSDTRLITLTGPGGTGKTRLARAIGSDVLPETDDGVWWIALDSIRDARLVVPEIAAKLEISEGSAPLLEEVKRVLSERRMLLILDNFEQVIEAAPLLGEVLRAAPGVKALVTSRTPLHIHGEREYAVPPLTVPPLDLPLDPDTVSAYPSVALFVDRASAVKSDFRMTADNARAIAELCVRLDGLPLAIELAAARIKVLPPGAMLARVEKRLKLLSGGASDLPARQQTMRAAISWGYNLLAEDDKLLFAILSVFRGGFDIEAAEGILEMGCSLAVDAGLDTTAASALDVVEGIESLLDKAFLRPWDEGREEQPRFLMLETIREYGLECLSQKAIDAIVHDAHARWMADFAEKNEHDGKRLTLEADNFRTAIDWACSTRDADLAHRLGAALWWQWYLHGQYSEGRRRLGEILEIPGGEEHRLRAKVATGAGALAFLQCDYEKAIRLLESSIGLARQHGDSVSLARALQFRGSIARERAEYEHAIDLHHLSRTIWEGLEDEVNAARSLNYVAFAAWLSGDVRLAEELSSRILPMFRDRADVEGVAWSLLNLAASALYRGALDEAEKRLEESVAWSRAGTFKEGVAWSLGLFGLVLRARGESALADRMLQDSLRLNWELGDRWRIASGLEAIGGLRGDSRLLGAAAALRERLGAPTPPVERPQLESDLARLTEPPHWNRDLEEAIRIALS